MTGSSLSIPSSPHRAIALIWNTLHLTDHPGLLYHRTVPIAHPGLLYHTAVPFAQPGLLLLLAPWNHSNISCVCHYMAFQWLFTKLQNMYLLSHRPPQSVPQRCTYWPTLAHPLPFPWSSMLSPLILAPWSQINVIIWLSSNGLSKSWQCQGHLLTKILLLAVGLPDQVLSDQGVCYTWYAASLYQFARPMGTPCAVNVWTKGPNTSLVLQRYLIFEKLVLQ